MLENVVFAHDTSIPSWETAKIMSFVRFSKKSHCRLHQLAAGDRF